MTAETKQTFPHDDLTPLPNERPTVSSLLLLNQEITANAISVYSIGGNGQLGHYAIVVDAATYATASNNTPFIVPPHPGANPVHLAGATQAIITETNRRYAADLIEFKTYITTEAALKKQLIAAIPGTYINQLKHQVLGFANVTPLQILQHLQQTYGTLTVDELSSNIAKMNKPWSPNDAIEVLFEQIRESRLFAAATDPISDATALRSALENVESSGVFGDAIRDFRKQPEAAKTYANFLTAFNLADAERRRILTTQAAGYHTAAMAIGNTPTPTGAAFATSNKHNTKPDTISGIYYCWTHGVGFNKDHTSTSCQSPQSGHRSESTIINMMGGNNFVRRQRNEKQIFVPTPKRTATPKITPSDNN
jgi:hypothetical protein